MSLRSAALLASSALLLFACSVETESSTSAPPAPATSEAPAEPELPSDSGAALDVAQQAQQELAQQKLAKQQAALAEKAKREKEAAQALAAKQAAQKQAAQKSAQASKDSFGLTPEQQKKKQAILDQKAAIKAGLKGGSNAGYDGPRGEGPRLTFKRSSVQFGEVWDTDTMKDTFEFTNTGKSTLVIDLVKASCGCTTAELEKMRYEPGESGKIDVEWKPKGFGQQVKTITLTSNSEGMLYTRVMIHATIKPFAKFDPEPTRFENARMFQEHKRTSTLSCVDPAFELISLTSSNENLVAEAGERAANGDLPVTLTLRDTAPWGMFNATVTARVRGVREAGEGAIERDAILHVGASVFGDLEVAPNLFSVGRVAPRGKINFSVIMSSADGNPFEVTRAEVLNSQPPGMTLRTEPLPDGTVRVYVEGEAGDYEGLIRGTAVLETNLEGEGERRLPIMGIVRP